MTDQEVTARRAALEAAVADRRHEADEVQRQVQANHERVHQLRQQLAARPADEFRPDGSVKAEERSGTAACPGRGSRAPTRPVGSS